MCERVAVMSELNGPVTARVMFVGEAPGRKGADRTRVPFSGDQSGKNFDRFLESIGLRRSEIFITSAALCNPRSSTGANRRPTQSEIRNCSDFLKRTFAVIDPAMDEVIGRYPVGRHSSSQMTMLRWQEISRCWSRKYSRPSRHCGLTGWMSSQSTTNMINSRPVIIFVHYWGRGPADKMATGFKAALDELGKENK